MMMLRKYYDSLRVNRAFFRTTFKQKQRILGNIMKFVLNGKKLILNHKPVIAQIENTSVCNLKCKMCVRDKIGVPIGSMSYKNFKKILDKLDSLYKIHLQGQGEPFTSSEIFKMIRYANKRGVLIMLNTNATLLNENFIKKICKLDIGGITLSIDSTQKEVYEGIRKGAVFGKVLKNVKLLTSQLRKNKRPTIVSIAAVIFDDNIDEIPKFINFAQSLGVKKVIFQIIQGKQDYVDKYDSKLKKSIKFSKKNIEKKIKQAKKIAKKKKIFVVFPHPNKSSGCIWPWRSIYITWNGYVTPCCKILDYRNPVFGNILKEDFWKIWNGAKYQKFRELLRKRKTPVPCQGCEMV